MIFRNIQEFFFRKALIEKGISKGKIRIDHFNGRCWHEKLGDFPVIFPESIIKKTDKLEKNKSFSYFFSGYITESRSWILNYPGVSYSSRGRNEEKKYSYDRKYHQSLCSSNFGLCPTGDCPWSYRFFEAIICFAIPVIGDKEKDIFSANFFFHRDSEPHYYSKSLAVENYELFLQTHTLKYIP